MQDDKLSCLDYDPLIFLRCHSKTDKDRADVRTQIWQVVFQPNKMNTVATCGGNKICIINLDTQRVEQRYSAEINETLFSLMWLNEQENNILVAGGQLGILYFISLEMKCQIANFAVPKLSKLWKIFSLTMYPGKSKTNKFFCAMSSGDIHLLSANIQLNEPCDINLITSFSCNAEVTRTAFCHYSSTLFAASSTGLYGWSTRKNNYDEWKDKKITFNMQMSANNSKPENNVVDSIEILKYGYVASKYALHSFIYIWHAEYSIARSDCESRIIEIVPFYKLIWNITENYYMEISTNCDLCILTCGDDKGNVWFYDIGFLNTKDYQSQMETQVLEAFNVIKWPKVEDLCHAKSKKLSLETDDIVIGKAVISPNGKYFVAITDRNIVCLWSRSSS